MSLDILGPGSALNAVTSRPSATTVWGSILTWFKPCSSITAQDGTQVTADWLNNLMAQLRTVISSAGVLQDGGDDMTWRAIEVMGLRYAVDSGAANALIISNAPPVPAYRAGLALAVKVAAANTGAATIAVDSVLPVANIVSISGAPLTGGEMAAGAIAFLVMDDALQFRLLIAIAPALSAPRTYYVNGSTGSDSYDGLASTVGSGHGPFKTIQHACNIATAVNTNGFTVTIDVADGTYAENVVVPQITGSGILQIIGDTTTPTNCIIAPAANSAIAFEQAGSYVLKGVELLCASATGADPGAGLIVGGSGCIVNIGNIVFGACATRHMFVEGGGTLNVLPTPQYLKVSGGTSRHMEVGGAGSSINLEAPDLTITTAVSITWWVVAAALGLIDGNNALLGFIPYNSITGKSNVTGTKYAVTMNSVVNTNGQGASYFPGGTAGATSTGGQYL